MKEAREKKHVSVNEKHEKRREARDRENKSFCIENASSETHADARYALDSASVLKAFRLIGGFDGIELDELYKEFGKLRNSQVRGRLLANLHDTFHQFDCDKNGVIDVLEFEGMVQSSTLLQAAVHELLTRLEEDERDELSGVDNEFGFQANSRQNLDAASCIITISNILVLAVQTDSSPNWNGWVFIELCFMCCFSIELTIRYCSVVRQKDCRSPLSDLRQFCCSPMVAFEICILSVGWFELATLFLDLDRRLVLSLRWLRIFRLARCIRIVRIFWYCQGLRVLLAGIASGIQSAIWGLAVIILTVFIWAIIMRTLVTSDYFREIGGETSDTDAILSSTFPSVAESMLVVFRCMALSADGSCSTRGDSSIILLCFQHFGWLFNFCWAASEAFILLALLNVITSVFVVQAAETSNKVKESISNATQNEDQMRLVQLDKLLRTLIHPGRQHGNPKDRHAAEVAKMIRTDHPEAAAMIPDLETKIVGFARSIVEAKKLHQSAMDTYEAKEVKACSHLRRIPSAKIYVVDGEEQLLADEGSFSNSLGLTNAPIGAVEKMLYQEHDNREQLLRDALEVQNYVKEAILPGSAWATNFKADSSGMIWKQSRGLCDEAIDPGPKSIQRIDQKVNMKYGGRYEKNRDFSRLALVYESVDHLVQALPRFLAFNIEADGMRVMSLENRFANPAPLGWRDVTMLLKVVIPSSLEEFYQRHHLVEVQMRLKGLMEVNHESHLFYEEIRSNLPSDVLTTIVDRLVTDTTLDLGITKSEWMQCLPNKEVKKILDFLGVPPHSRKGLFDIIDTDGSGTVTSSELQETLRLLRAPAQALELAGCHSRVRDIQRHMQNKLLPQMVMMHNFAVRCTRSHHNQLQEILEKLFEQAPRITGVPRRSVTSAIGSTTFGGESAVASRCVSTDFNFRPSAPLQKKTTTGSIALGNGRENSNDEPLSPKLERVLLSRHGSLEKVDKFLLYI